MGVGCRGLRDFDNTGIRAVTKAEEIKEAQKIKDPTVRMKTLNEIIKRYGKDRHTKKEKRDPTN